MVQKKWQLLSRTTHWFDWWSWKEAKASNSVEPFLLTRTEEKRESTEILQEGCWGQRLVPFTLWWGDMIVWAQTVGTSAPNPVQRGLQITRGTTGQHAIQWSKKQGGRGRKQTWREKQWTNRKDALKKVQLDSQNYISLRTKTMTPLRMSWLSWWWCMVETCNDLKLQRVEYSCHRLQEELDNMKVSTAAHLQGAINPLLMSFYISGEITGWTLSKTCIQIEKKKMFFWLCLEKLCKS